MYAASLNSRSITPSPARCAKPHAMRFPSFKALAAITRLPIHLKFGQKSKRPPELKLRRGDPWNLGLPTRFLKPPGESFGSTQRSASHRDSHFKQSLRPAMPAPPVGSSPSFRAVAFVCVVTSPNEVEPFSCRARFNLLQQSAAFTFIRAQHFTCQEKTTPWCPNFSRTAAFHPALEPRRVGALRPD